MEPILHAVSQAWSSQRCLDIEQQLEELIKNDDADNLFSFLYHQLGRSSSDDSTSNNFCLSELLVCACHYRAIKCAAMLIGGQLGQRVAFNAPLRDGSLPVYHAMQSLSFCLTKMFFNHGARTDLRCSPSGLSVNGLLPLNVAVESLSYYIEWTPKESVFKLVLILCLPELKEPLMSIGWLAERMQPEEVEDVIFQYAEEGKQIELAALLMVAQKNLYDLGPFFKHEKSLLSPRATLRECVAVEIASLIDVVCKLMGSRSMKFVQMCEERKRSMMSVMLLLEIYERAGKFLDEEATNCLASNPEHVASIFEKMGFPLTNEHVQVSRKEDCFSAVLPWEQSGKLEDVCLRLYMQPCSLPITKMRIMTRMPPKQQGCRSISTHTLSEILLCPQVPKLQQGIKGFCTYPCSTVGRKTMWSEILRLSPFYLAVTRGRIRLRGHYKIMKAP